MNKFVEDTNNELKEVFEEYNSAFNDFAKATEFIFDELEKALIERNNATLENRILKKEVEKLKRKLNGK